MLTDNEIDSIMLKKVNPSDRYNFDRLQRVRSDITREEWEAWKTRHKDINSMLNGTGFSSTSTSNKSIPIKREKP